MQVEQMSLHRLRASLDPRLHTTFAVRFWGEVNAIRRLIRERQIDLVLIGGLVNPHAAVAARLEKVPVVWQIIDSRTPRILRLLLLPVVARLADAVMFWGRALIALHVGRSPLKLPSFIFYPPVDSNRFSALGKQRYVTKRCLSIPHDALVVGMVGNLNPQKGIEYFIRAASILYRSQPNSWFVVVGARYETHYGYMNQLEIEVQRSGIPQEQFIFTGDRPDVENYYEIMDVALVTSVPRSEGIPTTVAEAMICGLPVVATDVGAVREAVEDGVTGFVVPPLDPSAIAHFTLRLLQDPNLRAFMGEEGRRRAFERYNVEICADTHAQAFKAAIAHHRMRNGVRQVEG
jgi:glycosyltransferase involved in cell wall biosynthesis